MSLGSDYIAIVEKSWDDLEDLVERLEKIPFTFNLGFPYAKYVNHEGWVYKYTFSRNTTGGYLIMDVLRMYDNEIVFHGKLNPWDLIWGRDPVTKMRRFLWWTNEIDITKNQAVIYAFYVPDEIKVMV